MAIWGGPEASTLLAWRLWSGARVEQEEGSGRHAASPVGSSVDLGGPWLSAGGVPRGGTDCGSEGTQAVSPPAVPSARPLSGRVFMLPALCILPAHLRMRGWQQVCALAGTVTGSESFRACKALCVCARARQVDLAVSSSVRPYGLRLPTLMLTAGAGVAAGAHRRAR